MLLQRSSGILKAIKHRETTASELMTKTTISRQCTSMNEQCINSLLLYGKPSPRQIPVL